MMSFGCSQSKKCLGTMMSTNAGFFVDEASKKAILGKLDKLPNNLKRNALSSALTAGARVIVKRAKTKAPACLVPTIKVKRRRQDKGGNIRVSVVAGRNGNLGSIGSLQENLKIANFLNKNGGSIDSCPAAFWVEFGTYQARDLKKNPYAPATLKRHPEYRTLGHTGSRNWDKREKWMQPRPFLRPALIESERDGSVRRAIITKLDEYIENKLGV